MVLGIRRSGRRGPPLRPDLVRHPRPAAARQGPGARAPRSSSSCRRCSIVSFGMPMQRDRVSQSPPAESRDDGTRAPEPEMRRTEPEPPTSAPPAPAPGPRGGDTAEVQPPPPVPAQPSRAPRASAPRSESEKAGDPAGGGGPPPGVPAARKTDWDVVPVFYGTDRVRKDEPKRIAYSVGPGAATGTGPRAGDRAEVAPGAQHRAPVRDPRALLPDHHLRAGRRPQAALHHPAS